LSHPLPTGTVGDLQGSSEQSQRPDIESAPGEIDPAPGTSGDARASISG
jgi:hypothetical protein